MIVVNVALGGALGSLLDIVCQHPPHDSRYGQSRLTAQHETFLSRPPGTYRLDLRNNNIQDPGLDALAEGMECNSSIERLFIWGNKFGQASLRRLAELEAGRFALVDVFLDVQPFLVDGEFHAAERSV